MKISTTMTGILAAIAFMAGCNSKNSPEDVNGSGNPRSDSESSYKQSNSASVPADSTMDGKRTDVMQEGPGSATTAGDTTKSKGTPKPASGNGVGNEPQ